MDYWPAGGIVAGWDYEQDAADTGLRNVTLRAVDRNGKRLFTLWCDLDGLDQLIETARKARRGLRIANSAEHPANPGEVGSP